MPIQVASFLVPKNGAKWFVLEDTYLRGGYRVVPSSVERDALHSSCLKQGMLVKTINDDKTWELQQDLTYKEILKPSSYFYTHVQTVSDNDWLVTHNKNSIHFICNIFDYNKSQVIANSIYSIDSNNIRITFSSSVTGHAVFAFDLA